jgi:hypothetical protein
MFSCIRLCSVSIQSPSKPIELVAKDHQRPQGSRALYTHSSRACVCASSNRLLPRQIISAQALYPQSRDPEREEQDLSLICRIPRVACRLRKQDSIYLLYWYKSTSSTCARKGLSEAVEALALPRIASTAGCESDACIRRQI